jgi:hypothetical protein
MGKVCQVNNSVAFSGKHRGIGSEEFFTGCALALMMSAVLKIRIEIWEI